MTLKFQVASRGQGARTQCLRRLGSNWNLISMHTMDWSPLKHQQRRPHRTKLPIKDSWDQPLQKLSANFLLCGDTLTHQGAYHCLGLILVFMYFQQSFPRLKYTCILLSVGWFFNVDLFKTPASPSPLFWELVFSYLVSLLPPLTSFPDASDHMSWALTLHCHSLFWSPTAMPLCPLWTSSPSIPQAKMNSFFFRLLLGVWDYITMTKCYTHRKSWIPFCIVWG